MNHFNWPSQLWVISFQEIFVAFKDVVWINLTLKTKNLLQQILVCQMTVFLTHCCLVSCIQKQFYVTSHLENSFCRFLIQKLQVLKIFCLFEFIKTLFNNLTFILICDFEDPLNWKNDGPVVDWVFFNFFDGFFSDLSLNFGFGVGRGRRCPFKGLFGGGMSLLRAFFRSKEFDLVFLHVLGLLDPLIDKLLGPRKLIPERHQSFPVALKDIMGFNLILDCNQMIHDVGVIKLLINLCSAR